VQARDAEEPCLIAQACGVRTSLLNLLKAQRFQLDYPERFTRTITCVCGGRQEKSCNGALRRHCLESSPLPFFDEVKLIPADRLRPAQQP
jgi:hypothetical protein